MCQLGSIHDRNPTWFNSELCADITTPDVHELLRLIEALEARKQLLA